MKILIIIRAFFSVFLAVLLFSCGHRNYKKSTLAGGDGQLHGIAPARAYTMPKPFGMVYIPQGVFKMGVSDEDPAMAFSNRTNTVSINGFWMDATEVTNNEYRQFVNWVRDSVTAAALGYVVTNNEGQTSIDWRKMKSFNYTDSKNIISLETAGLHVAEVDKIFGKKEFNPDKLIYYSEVFDLKEAAKRSNINIPRSNFIIIKKTKVFPDTLAWIRDFAYSYNEPMTKRYFSHPAFGNYPVVGVNWHQAIAFCEWRSLLLNNYLTAKNKSLESSYRLPTEAEWEYAARGGRSQSMFPWGNYYLRNKKGCLLANFKPGRGSYPEDGGFYTVRADSYWPNDYGLYCMSGNVAEWTASMYYEGRYNFQHDMNPDISYNARLGDAPVMKRKVIRGGSWKDVGYYLQTGTSTYEYQDSTKSYIGFRCVIDLSK